jgi:hypothetical protein
MCPIRPIKNANAAVVRIMIRVVVRDGDQSVRWPASHVTHDRARHSSVCLIVNHPVCSVEAHQSGGRSDPNSSARVRFYIKDVTAGQGRIAWIVDCEGAVVTGDKFPQAVLRAHP